MTQTPSGTHAGTQAFRGARDLLFTHRANYEACYRDFRWPDLDDFNWALDWFDVMARGNDRLALWIVEPDGSEEKLTFDQLAARSDEVAGWLRSQGVRRGDRLLLMLGNDVPLWETILASMKLGAVIIPASTLLRPDDLTDRVERGNVRHVVVGAADTGKFADVPKGWTPIVVGEPVEGWLRYTDAYEFTGEFSPDGPTKASDPLLLYFTSGTTAQPKLVEHTHASYPVGHLSTMYWIGIRPGDVHLNISSPGWAKHAWSNVFAPWDAEATVLIVRYGRFDATTMMDAVARCGVTTFCAPPTVWRLLVQEDLSAWRTSVREAASAGEPLNPEVIEQVRRAWDITVRDGYGQTETTCQIGNPPGAEVVLGSMGRPLPGYSVVLVDPATGERGAEGEICLDLAGQSLGRPLGLMTGYRDDDRRTAEVMRDGVYHTGDVGRREDNGYITYVGRTDDVFKSSDYRISPFELESVLIEHEAVAEAAVVPSPDPLRLSVPKAYVMVAGGYEPTSETAFSILRYAREHLAPYKRVRRLEFGELPKTISGKIRRVELRGREDELHGPTTEAAARGEGEYWEDDFPTLKS
ncbi:MAG: AMP-binding protein [Streptosporangiaceae bacterium]